MDNYWRYYGRSMISFCFTLCFFFLLCGVTESNATSLFPLIYLYRCERNYNNSLLRQKNKNKNNEEQFRLKIYHVKNKLFVFFKK